MKDFIEFGIIVPPGSSGDIKTTCPKCSKDRKKQSAPCLSVNVDEGVWHCWHCELTGSLLSGWSNDPQARKEKNITYVADGSGLSPKVIEYFQDRKIPKLVLEKNRIGYGVSWMPGPNKEVGCVQFPYTKNGKIVNIKYRDGQKNFKQEKGGEKCLYRFDEISKRNGTLIITEGEVDCLSLISAGYEAVTSVPDGAPSPETKNYEKKFTYLEGSEDVFKRYEKIIIAVDNDAPGKKLEEELGRRIGHEKCYRISYPKDCKDANDILKKYGIEELKYIIEAAKPFPIDGLFTIKDLQNDTFKLYSEGFRPTYKTGWPILDQYYRVRPCEFTVVTGIPGSGKSNFIDALMVNLWLLHDWSFCVCSPENWPVQRHVAAILEKIIGKPFDRSGMYSPRMTEDEMLEGLARIHGYFNFIMMPNDDMTVDAILSRIKASILRHGIKGAVIDPWNEIDHHRPTELTEHEYISLCLTKIRRFARMNDIHIWIVAHPKKLQKDKDTNKYPMPTLYDISGSSTWYDKSDNGIAIHRKYDEDKTEVGICKIRFKEVGRLGKVELKYERDTGKYIEN